MRVAALLPLVALLALAGGAEGASTPAPATSPAGRDFEFAKLNRGYRDLMAEAPEYRNGSFTVRLASPRQSLIVKSHRLRLAPRPDGSFDAALGVEFYGNGWLVADVAYGSLVQRFEGQLFVPAQRVELPARLRVVHEAGGFRFLATGLPPEVKVEIRSQLADQVVALCDGAAVLALGQLDCGSVERGLTRVAVPLPAAGAEFFLAHDELAPAERTALESFLAAKR